jgi:lanthanide-dependent methanol dehydrogenase
VWRTKLGDINRGESMTMAPLVVKGQGAGGQQRRRVRRAWLDHRAERRRPGASPGAPTAPAPTADVLIGPDFKPVLRADRGVDLGVTTWPPDMWRMGGGTVWGWISYDPELDLIYYGTGNPGRGIPSSARATTSGRPASSRATRHRQARWAYQWTPHDEHDYDGVNENVLLDLPIGGALRKVLVRPERNGFIYVIDRATGEVLSADPFVHTTVNWAFGVDLETGRPMEEGQGDRRAPVARDICPAAPGGKDWQPSAWSPRTRLLYMPHNHLCMDSRGVEANYIAGTPFVGARW